MQTEMLYRDEKMREVVKLIGKVAPYDISVLVTGETGTGKELVANHIHRHSKRADEPFVAINCAAIPPDLLVSELFGHRKGAFTGATIDRPGYFESAGKGTVFLDEIAEMAPDAQTMLLRALQEKKGIRLGSNEEYDINARVVTATNRDPMQAIAEGKLREDLFYRINGVPIRLPALRERGSDAIYIAETTAKRYGKELAERAMAFIATYSWPGNVRQLISAVERGRIVAESNEISRADLTYGMDISSAVSKPTQLVALPTQNMRQAHCYRLTGWEYRDSVELGAIHEAEVSSEGGPISFAVLHEGNFDIVFEASMPGYAVLREELNQSPLNDVVGTPFGIFSTKSFKTASNRSVDQANLSRKIIRVREHPHLFALRREDAANALGNGAVVRSIETQYEALNNAYSLS